MSSRGGKRRAVVLTSGRIPRRGRPRLWAYGYEDLALLFGMRVEAVRTAVAEGRLEPGDLTSVIAFAERRQRRARKRLA